MNISLDKIYVTQKYLVSNNVFWYLQNENVIPIAVRNIPKSDAFLVLDGHHQLAGDFLRNQEPNYKIIESINDIIDEKEFPENIQLFVRKRNSIIESRFDIIFNFGHQDNKMNIIDLMNYRACGAASFLDILFFYQKDYLKAKKDLFKNTNIRDDLIRYKI